MKREKMDRNQQLTNGLSVIIISHSCLANKYPLFESPMQFSMERQNRHVKRILFGHI